MNDEDYVKRSKYRTNILKSLKSYPRMPSEIAKAAGMYQNHISTTLRQLSERELVECINPEVRKGRLYRLTDLGEEVADKLDE